MVCCFRECTGRGPAALRLFITPPPDGETMTLWAHEECFARLHDPTVLHDDPKDHGRIPAGARCAFCGRALPIIGEHPLVFDRGNHTPPHRFWSHAQCMGDRLVPIAAETLNTDGRSTDTPDPGPRV